MDSFSLSTFPKKEEDFLPRAFYGMIRFRLIFPGIRVVHSWGVCRSALPVRARLPAKVLPELPCDDVERDFETQ